MSYLVLARKYRPQTFHDVVGQQPVVKTLANSLKRNRVAHALLFSGVRGVGKTTLARIMAKAINCEGTTDNKPCNGCDRCLEIVNGQSLDLHEIDGASNRGIQEIRELKEKIRFMPTASRYKIIIIDEVHMLTTEAFNALLKTLEEPPDHVFFMFATTELHKIPITILSRCQRYELKRVPTGELTTHFQKIVESEGKTIDPQGLSLVVREAGGSVRDGLSLLDQIFAYGDNHITSEDIIQVLGLTDRTILLQICKALLTGDRVLALQTLNGAFEYGMDFKRFTGDLLECMRTILLVKIGNLNSLIDLPLHEIELLSETASDISIETIHLKLTLLIEAVEHIRKSSQPRLSLETAFLKIIEAGNIAGIPTLINKLETILTTLPDTQAADKHSPVGKKKLPTGENDLAFQQSSLKPPVKREEKPGANTGNLTNDHKRPKHEDDSQPAPAGHIFKQQPTSEDAASTTLEEVPAARQTTSTQIESSDKKNPDINTEWDSFLEYVAGEKILLANDLKLADTFKLQDTELFLHYTDPEHCTYLNRHDNLKLLNQFILDFFKKDLNVRVVVPEKTAEKKEGSQALKKTLANHPLVDMAVEIFNGQVGDIRPLIKKDKSHDSFSES